MDMTLNSEEMRANLKKALRLGGTLFVVTAVTGLLLGLVEWVTRDAIRMAAADCISQASGKEVVLAEKEAGNADWLGEAPEIADADITEELDTEVLVVGCGTGGWITAMTAAEEGARVLVVEKGETPTGIREDIGAIDSKIQIAEIEKNPNLAIDKMEALQDIVRYASDFGRLPCVIERGRRRGNRDVIRNVAHEQLAILHHHADMLAQRPQVDFRHIMLTEEYAAALSFLEA